MRGSCAGKTAKNQHNSDKIKSKNPKNVDSLEGGGMRVAGGNPNTTYI